MVGFKFSALVTVTATLIATAEAQKKPIFHVNNLPDKWEPGQVGSNQCKKWGDSSPDSMCQNVFVNSANDFCLFLPYTPNTTIGDEEERTVSYCTRSGYGTRVFSPGTIKGAQFLKTPNYLQVTGYGDFTKVVAPGDEGGELDPHGATGAGNPPGGLVFSNAIPGHEGHWRQSREWSSFASATEFSIRLGYGSKAALYAPHIYDEMGAQWNHPGKYYHHKFEDCDGDSGAPPGVYGDYTFHQGDPKTPPAHPPPASSNCHPLPSPDGGLAPQKPYRKRALPTAVADRL
ncbi:uncharacterized protein PSFLO_01620 [Pseudozyma flocculosa]|nr:uncharacterized protein PSFLO_01620 [Pseudozyma flocculosa]